jgi:hypothetical protein
MVMACDQTPLQPPTEPVALQEATAVSPQLRSVPSERLVGLDRAFAELQRQAQGFAGVYYGPSGDLVVRAVGNTAHQDAAKRAAEQFIREQRGVSPRISVELAHYNFGELLAWKQMIAGRMPRGLLSEISVCEQHNQVCVGVRQPGGLAVLSAIVRQSRIPAAAVRGYLDDDEELFKTLSDIFNPVPAGVEIDDICTIGYNALYGTTRVFLTASHCLFTFGSVSSDVVGQYDDAVRDVGYESYDPPTFPCSAGPRCRYSDVAEVTYYDSVSYRLGRIARPYYQTTTIDPSNPEFVITAQVQYPLGGEVLERVGKTTGWHRGTVTDTCVDMPSGQDVGTVWLLCQDRVSATVATGDSGGPVFRLTGSNSATLYGIVWGGGSSYYNFSSINNIEVGDGFGTYVKF